MSWFDDKNNIVIENISDLMKEANIRQFGENGNEDLCSFLLCEAFENRFDPSAQRAFRLAAMIISRIEK